MIRFNGPNGEASEFSAKELEFFATPIGLKKIMLTSFLLYRIILNLRWQSAVLFAKHSLQVLLGMNPIDLDRTEYTKIIEGFIGFKPVSASGLYRIKINFSDGGMSFADIIVLYAQIVVADQYCLKKSNIRGKIAIDAGANQGIFSIFAARLGAAKVYAFEPVAPTYELLKKNIEANSLEGVVIPINKALADKPGRARIKYLYPGDGTAFIQQSEALSVQQPEGRRTSGLAAVATIDGFMRGKGKVDFIKMDVEGFEEKVLLGAQKTIEKYKPILSFSAYHKKEDAQRLPELAMKLRQDYSCELVHRSELDIYCH